MLDTARSFAIRWLLEPEKKSVPKGIRFTIGLVGRDEFSEFSEVVDIPIHTTIKDGTVTGTRWMSIGDNVLAVKIYDGAQYIGAYTSMSSGSIVVEEDGVKTETGSYPVPYYDYTCDIHYRGEFIDHMPDGDEKLYGWQTIILSSVNHSYISTVSKINGYHLLNYVYVTLLYSRYQELDHTWWEELGRYEEYYDRPGTWQTKISLNGRYDYIYTSGLTNDMRKEYIDMFNANSNVLEYEI